ncbi:MAG: mechanosensitive ion channel domain-containing protein [Desulfovibrio sp.]
MINIRVASHITYSVLWCVLVVFLTVSHPSRSLANEDYDFLKNRVQSFQAFEAEEGNTINLIEELILQSQKTFSEANQKIQYIVFSDRSSIISPNDRKKVKINLYWLRKDIQDFLERLENANEESSARIEVLKSFKELSVNMPSDIPLEIREDYSSSLRSVDSLRKKSSRQLSKVTLLEKEGKRILGRIDNLEKGEKLNLFQLWSNYLLAETAPVFSVSFWEKPFVGFELLSHKKDRIEYGFKKYRERLPQHLFTCLALLVFGIVVRGVVQKKVIWRYSIIHQQVKIKVLSWVALTSLAFYVATRFVFPSSLEVLAYLSFSVFFYAILKLSKYIARDKHVFTSGRVKTSVLFTVSVLLISLHFPGKWVTFIILSVLMMAWGFEAFLSWKKNKFSGLSDLAKKSSFLSPVMLVALFGFGRLACLLIILWSLVVFIRAFGLLWGQLLFGSVEKGEKLLMGLVSSLAVPLGWGVAFFIVYYWLAGFFGLSAIEDALSKNVVFYNYSISIRSVVTLGILFFITKSCVAAFNVSIEHVGSRWPKGKRGAIPSIQTLFTYGVWSLFVVVALRGMDVNLTSIAVVAGGLSVGIGFGLQNIVNNFISGLILLFGRSIQQGDVIEIGGLWCTVQKINIRTTLVETFENAVIMIPNSDLVTTQMTNWTKNSVTLRRDILVGVAYGSDTNKVRTILLNIALENPHVLKTPEPCVIFSDFGASSLDFILRIWIDDIDYAIRSLSELRFEIDQAFRREGVEIAFPQMDVHIKEFAQPTKE